MTKNYRIAAILGASLISAALVSPTMAQSAPTCCAQPSPSILNINTTADLKQAPDIAMVSAGVVTQHRSARNAMADNATKMSAAFAALRAAGIAERDLQTAGINLAPQYVYEENKPPRLTGYQVTNTVNVKIRDMTKIGPVLDALVAQGINQISGPNFQIEDSDAALDRAREEAMRKAMRRGDLYARGAGMRIKRVVSINESGGYQPQPQPMVMMSRMAADVAQQTPVASGEVTMSIQLSVQ
ncbi:MAG: SIMPL domain-containing protein, partial [Pseudomonadota bacterium]